MMGRFSCDILEKPVKRAIANARLKYPLLGARIEQDREGNARFAFDNVPDFQIKIVGKKTENQWFELAWREQQEPFDMGKGPLVKFLLFRSAESADLVVICHHIICDGLSLAYLIKDIASFLQELDVKVEPMPLPPSVINDDLKVKISPSWIYRIAIAWTNRAWKKSKTVFGENDYAQIYRDYWKSKDIGMAVISLPEDITSTFIHRCQEEHVTVNSALTTAFAFAQYDMEGRNKPYLRKALVAVNIRDLFKNRLGENFGFLAGGAEVILPDKTKELWDAARRFNIQMTQLRSSPKKLMEGVAALNSVEPTLMDAVYFAAYGDFRNKTALSLKGLVLTKTGEPRRSLDITNIGLVSLGKNANLETMFFVPILSSNYEKAIAIVTAGGEMNIIMLHDVSQFSPASMEDFKQKIIGYIREVSAATKPQK